MVSAHLGKQAQNPDCWFQFERAYDKLVYVAILQKTMGLRRVLNGWFSDIFIEKKKGLPSKIGVDLRDETVMY